MSIDTLAKRESITNLLMPGFASITWPSGTVDRASAMWLYSMGAAGEIPTVSFPHYLIFSVESSYLVVVNAISTKTLIFEVQ
jgi:hypothetical protein